MFDNDHTKKYTGYKVSGENITPEMLRAAEIEKFLLTQSKDLVDLPDIETLIFDSKLFTEQLELARDVQAVIRDIKDKGYSFQGHQVDDTILNAHGIYSTILPYKVILRSTTPDMTGFISGTGFDESQFYWALNYTDPNDQYQVDAKDDVITDDWDFDKRTGQYLTLGILNIRLYFPHYNFQSNHYEGNVYTIGPDGDPVKTEYIEDKPQFLF